MKTLVLIVVVGISMFATGMVGYTLGKKAVPQSRKSEMARQKNEPREVTPSEIRDVSVEEWFNRIGKDSERGDQPFTAMNALVKKSGQSREIGEQIILSAIETVDDPLQNDLKRWQSCYVLSGIGDPRGISPLTHAMKNGSVVVRGVAACALGAFAHADATAALEDAAKTEQNPEVQAWIQKALNGEMKKQSSAAR